MIPSTRFGSINFVELAQPHEGFSRTFKLETANDSSQKVHWNGSLAFFDGNAKAPTAQMNWALQNLGIRGLREQESIENAQTSIHRDYDDEFGEGKGTIFFRVV